MMHHLGQLLYERNSNDQKFPASITKVLTAIVVMENCKLDDTVTVTQSAIDSIEEGYVTGNLKDGEVLTVEQLLNILLVSSANDAAVVLAEHISRISRKFC